MTRRRPISTVGGESARLLLDTIRGFPLRVAAGRVEVIDTATGPDVTPSIVHGPTS
jgi:hypothetical protein